MSKTYFVNIFFIGIWSQILRSLLLKFVLVYFCWVKIVIHFHRICVILNVLRESFLLACQRFRIWWKIIFVLRQFLLFFDFSQSFFTNTLRLKICAFIFIFLLEIVENNLVLLVDWSTCFSRLVLITMLLGWVDFREEFYVRCDSLILALIGFDCVWLRVALIFYYLNN